MVECPWCVGTIALADDASELTCDVCSVRVEIARDDPAIEGDIAQAA